ncbi:MAG TPA: AraC family transcriptional regulator [Steroidobacteraceae bacterium]|jgi:AraC family transcriptional regulator
MAKTGIVATVNGTVRRPVDGAPRLSSADTAWEGFILEQHYTPPLKELPGNIKFSGHIIAMSRCPELVRFFYREPALPLFIERSTMTRVCEESNGGRQAELIPRNDLQDKVLQTLLSTLVADLMAGRPTGRIFGESLATAIAAYVGGKYSVFSTRLAEYRDGLTKQRLNDVIDYIQSNLHGNLGVAEIARVAFKSPYYFGKLFKRSTGQTIHQYVLEQRVLRAQSLLSTTDIGLTEIACSVGLSNQSHFTTVFKTKLGVTPRCFRIQSRSHH